MAAIVNTNTLRDAQQVQPSDGVDTLCELRDPLEIAGRGREVPGRKRSEMQFREVRPIHLDVLIEIEDLAFAKCESQSVRDFRIHHRVCCTSVQDKFESCKRTYLAFYDD